MLANFDTFNPNTSFALFIDDLVYSFVNEASCCLAADVRQNADIGQTGVPEFFEPRSLGVVLGDHQRMVEHVVQPLPNGLQAAEIVAPTPLVELARREDELERQRIAMQQAAVGVICPPLPKAAG